jgi:ADP-ribose pyrophosphatase
MSLRKWQKLRSTPLQDHRVFVLREDVCVSPRTGVEQPFVVLDAPDWVAVVALTSAGQLILVRQYRHGSGELGLEVPGGLVDEGATPEEAAREELREETGYGGGRWSRLGQLTVVPALFNNKLHVFLAEDVQRLGDPPLDESEDIEVVELPLDEAERMVATGEIDNAQVVAGLYLYQLRQAAGDRRPEGAPQAGAAGGA